MPDLTIDLSHAVNYHYGVFPPQTLDLPGFFNEILTAAESLARYDQMLKTLHNSEILLAPLRSREAVISSRIEGTISTLDEILRYEAEAEAAQLRAKYGRTPSKPCCINAPSSLRSKCCWKDGHLVRR